MSKKTMRSRGTNTLASHYKHPVALGAIQFRAVTGELTQSFILCHLTVYLSRSLENIFLNYNFGGWEDSSLGWCACFITGTQV